MPRLIASALVAVLLAAPGSVAAQEPEDLGPASREGRVAAHAGRVVWNVEVPRGFVLMTRYGGRTTRVPVARRRERGFDVDLGPGPRGNTVAVYSRCRFERVRKGCDLFLYDFARGRERRLRAVSRRDRVESLPSIWRSRVAFVRDVGQAPRAARRSTRIVVARLDGRVERTVRGGSRPNRSNEGVGFLAVQLHRADVAFAWAYAPRRCPVASEEPAHPNDFASELWLVRGNGRRSVMARGCNGDEAQPGSSFTLELGRLTYLVAERGPVEDPLAGRILLYERDLATGAVRRSAEDVTGPMALDDADAYFVTGGRLLRRRVTFG